jgi:DNA-directed RNA polymerase subunit alpha
VRCRPPRRRRPTSSNCLKRARVDTIGQLVQKTEDDLLAITNFGSKSLEEVLQKLDERGLSLRVKE